MKDGPQTYTFLKKTIELSMFLLPIAMFRIKWLKYVLRDFKEI